MIRPRWQLPASALLGGWLVALAVPAQAGELYVDRIGVHRGLVAAEVRLEDAFDADTRASIASGLPVTVRFTVELWRERRRWFDKQVDARVITYRVRWDPGERLFTLTRPGRTRVDSYEELDPLLAELSQRLLPVHPRWELEERHRFFLTAEAAIRPLTLEEFRELDGWIEGRLRGGPDPEPPPEAEEGGDGVAGAVFGFLKDLSGFGDILFRARTPSFRVASLTPLDPEAP